jgi:MYXO-CTERM domain-containing protein
LNPLERSKVIAAPLLAALSVPSLAAAADLYVSPTGSDSAAGTEAAPLSSLARAQELVQPGDTVFLRAGTYAFSAGTTTCKSGTDTISGVVLNKSGSAGKPIRYFAYPGEKPVLDFDGIRDSCRIKGILVSADYVHLKGLELKGVRQNNDLNHESWGVWNQGSHNVFELLDVHHIMGAGIFIQRGGDNLVLNCDSHHNLDEHTSNGAGESADGFGCHVDAADTGNVFRGCRAWWNADDGYDFINADAPCTVEHSWAWLNGYKPGTMESIGNGNGIKAGGYGADPAKFPAKPAEHVVRFCLAFANKAAGFYANHHPSSLLFYNNTSYANHPNFNMLGMDDAGGDITVGKYRNNIALAGTLFSNRSAADDAGNSWTLAGLMVSDADFQSVATTGMDAPRQADGSLPLLPNFRLAEGSDLIDRGSDLGLPFAGEAPDLGAFELGLEQPGSAGSGGAAGGAAGSSGGGNLAGSPGVAGGSGGAPSSAGAAGKPSSSGGAPPAAGSAGAPQAAAAGTSALATPPTEPADGGCACRTSHTSSSRSSVLWGLLLLVGLRRRSRYGKRVAAK